MKLSRYKMRGLCPRQRPLSRVSGGEAHYGRSKGFPPQCSKRYSRTRACISSSRSILQIMLLALP